MLRLARIQSPLPFYQSHSICIYIYIHKLWLSERPICSLLQSLSCVLDSTETVDLHGSRSGLVSQYVCTLQKIISHAPWFGKTSVHFSKHTRATQEPCVVPGWLCSAALFAALRVPYILSRDAEEHPQWIHMTSPGLQSCIAPPVPPFFAEFPCHRNESEKPHVSKHATSPGFRHLGLSQFLRLMRTLEPITLFRRVT